MDPALTRLLKTISSLSPALAFVNRALIKFSSIELFWAYHLSLARTLAPNVCALLSNPSRREGKWGLRGWNVSRGKALASDNLDSNCSLPGLVQREMRSTEQIASARYNRGLDAFIQQLFRAYCVLSPGLGAGNTEEQSRKSPALQRLTLCGGNRQ